MILINSLTFIYPSMFSQRTQGAAAYLLLPYRHPLLGVLEPPPTLVGHYRLFPGATCPSSLSPLPSIHLSHPSRLYTAWSAANIPTHHWRPLEPSPVSQLSLKPAASLQLKDQSSSNGLDHGRYWPTVHFNQWDFGQTHPSPSRSTRPCFPRRANKPLGWALIRPSWERC